MRAAPGARLGRSCERLDLLDGENLEPRRRRLASLGHSGGRIRRDAPARGLLGPHAEVEDRAQHLAMFVHAAGADAFPRVRHEQSLDLGSRHLGNRHVAKRRHDAADRDAVAAPVRRAGLGEHRAVIPECRGLGAEDEFDVLEPRVRERAKRRAARGSLTSGGLGGLCSVCCALGLRPLHELDEATPCLVRGQVPRRWPAAAWTPTAPTIPGEPRARAEPPAHPLSVRAAPLDRPHRLARVLGRLDQQKRRRQRVVNGHQEATVHPLSDGRTSPKRRADQLVRADLRADQSALKQRPRAQFCRS